MNYTPKQLAKAEFQFLIGSLTTPNNPTHNIAGWASFNSS